MKRPVRLAYQPPDSSTFLSEQISHHQPVNSIFLSEQTSTSRQPPAKRTGCRNLRRDIHAYDLPNKLNMVLVAHVFVKV
jgi:hypothetical protein